MTHTAIDLFSGCGGLSRGLKDAEYKVLAAVEIDKKACETYRVNHTDVPLLEADIREVNASHLLKRSGLRRGNASSTGAMICSAGAASLAHPMRKLSSTVNPEKISRPCGT